MRNNEINRPWIDPITVTNTRIINRNFAGKPGDFNAEGDRNFGLVISKEDADVLAPLGWAIKVLPPREGVEGSEPCYFISKVRVSFRKKSGEPSDIEVYMISNGKKIPLDEDSISVLDTAIIKSVDAKLDPSPWARSGKSGVSAYVKKLFVHVEEVVDELSAKYADMPIGG